MAKLKKVSIRNDTKAPRMFYGGESNQELIRVLPGQTVEALLRGQLVEDTMKARDFERTRDTTHEGEVEITVLGEGPEELPPPGPPAGGPLDDLDEDVRREAEAIVRRRRAQMSGVTHEVVAAQAAAANQPPAEEPPSDQPATRRDRHQR